MQETWRKWSRWRNYIKYEADILINQTKMSIEWKWKGYAKQKDNAIWENTKSLLLSNDHQNNPPQVSTPWLLTSPKRWHMGLWRGGESPTKLKLEDYRAQQHTEWVRLVHCYFRTKILNRWYQDGAWQRIKMHTKNIRKHRIELHQHDWPQGQGLP